MTHSSRSQLYSTAIAFVVIACLTGCSAQGNLLRTDPTVYPPKPSSYNIPIMSGWTLPHLVDTEKSQYLPEEENWHGFRQET